MKTSEVFELMTEEFEKDSPIELSEEDRKLFDGFVDDEVYRFHEELLKSGAIGSYPSLLPMRYW